MKTTLAEAIESLTLHSASTHKLRDWQPEIQLVVAAARCLTCKECGGRGKIHHANSDTNLSCRSCSFHREIVRNGLD